MSDAEESGAGSYEEQVDAAEQDAGLTGSEAEDGGAADKLSGKKRKRVATELTAEKLAEFEAAERRKGVVSGPTQRPPRVPQQPNIAASPTRLPPSHPAGIPQSCASLHETYQDPPPVTEVRRYWPRVSGSRRCVCALPPPASPLYFTCCYICSCCASRVLTLYVCCLSTFADPAAYRRRVKAGGNKRLQFTEGWVEFLDKHVAKAVAAMLTNQPMGGNKRGFYASDVWSIKYLKHFKWHHLTEKVAYEKRVAAAKLRAELSKAKKEAELYVSRVEQAHALEHMEAKRKGKAKGGAGAGSAAAAGGDGDGEEGDRFGGVRRSFKQRQALPDASLEALGLAPAPAAAAAAVVEGAAASGGGSGRKSTGGGKGSDSSKGEAKGHSSSGGGSGSAKRRKVGASE